VTGDRYVLECDDLTVLRLIDLIDRVSSHADDATTVALRRFGFSYERAQPDDRLIDGWIGLEALLTTSNERSETTDKISRRLGRLLGRTQAERLEVKREAKKLYDRRCAVVHGSKTTDDLRTEADRAVDLLRRAVRLRLERSWTPEQLEDEMMQ
jgi:hypothetical protein